MSKTKNTESLSLIQDYGSNCKFICILLTISFILMVAHELVAHELA